MARSNNRAAAVATLFVLGYLCLAQLAAFVTPRAASSGGRGLRSRVSLAATKADVEAAQKTLKLQQWAANQLASEGSPLAAAAATRAQQAEAAYLALKAEMDGTAPPAAAAPAVPEPVPVAAEPAAAPVAAAPAAVSQEDLAEAKKQASLLTWAANKLASEGSPGAAAMQAKADQAVAAYEALKQGEAAPAAVPAAAPAAVPEPAPVAAAPAAAAPVASSAAPSDEEVKQAKKTMDLLKWAAEQLTAQGAPQAAAMQAKAEESRQTYEALKAQTLVSR